MILIKDRGQWIPAVLTSYKNEAELQALLAADGDLVGCSGAAAVREFPTAGGPIDLLYVDAEGVITVVECKLSSSPEIKRKVVGQLIDYASALARMDHAEFAERFAAKTGQSVEAAVSLASGEAINPTAWRELLQATLTNGSFRLGIAVDQITESLKRSVEFLNSHSTDSVVFFALELGYVKRDGTEILVTDRFGDQAEDAGKGPASGTTKHKWTTEEIERAVGAVTDSQQRDFVRAVLDHAQTHGATIKGGVGGDVSAGFYYPVFGKRPSLWSLWVGDATQMSLNIASLRNVSEERAVAAFRALSGSTAISERFGTEFESVAAKYPSFRVEDVVSDPDALPALLRYLDVALDEPQRP